VLDERDARSLGHARSVRAKAALEHADAMLAVGCRFTEVMTEFRRMKVPQQLAQIDLADDQIGMNHPVKARLHGEAKAVLRELIARLPAGADRPGWNGLMERARSTVHPSPEWLITTLRAELGDEVPVFTDACEMAYRMHTDYPSHGPRRFFYPSNYISLGWGFPAAVGAAAATPGRPVVSVSGDGGFVMTSQELATAVRHRLRVIAIIHNDGSYGAMKNIQRIRFEGRYVDSELNNPDFVLLASAYGVPASRVHDAAALASALRAALSVEGPTLIEVPDRWRYLRTW